MRVEVLVREDLGPGEPGQLRRIHGERHHLERHAVAAGAVELGDAVAHWWVLDDDHRGRRREAGMWASTGHAGAVFGDELYDVLPQTRGGYGRLQDFGIRFGYEPVVLHLEPRVQTDRLQANTARTMLLLDHEPLPWSRWGEEFADRMPDEIRRLQERAASADCLPRQEAIRSRINAILPLYQLSRYRPTRPPQQPRTGSGANRTSHEPAARPSLRPQTLSSAPAADSVHAAVDAEAVDDRSGSEPERDQADSDPGSESAVDLPDVAWVSARDGSRAPGDLEDQAARYHPGRHELTINADFRAITDLTAHWRQCYRAVPGAPAVIEAHVREWCEQVLLEVVLAARNSGWSADQLDVLLSPTSLTAALLPRHLLHATLQKRLGQKLGATRHGPGGLVPDASSAPRSRRPRGARAKRQESGEQTA